MADFSRLPKDDLDAAQKAGYIGIYFEQGVPILDRDLNLLQSMVAENVRSIVRSYIGDGVPAVDGGFQIKAIPADNDFLIGKGKCLVDGIEIEMQDDTKYSALKPAPPPLTKPGSGTRTDTVYLDVALQTVESGPGADDPLRNPGDVGMQTSVRVKRVWSVAVAEGGDPPALADGHVRHVLAKIARRADTAKITDDMISDLRQTRLSLDAVEKRMRDVELLRVEPALSIAKPFDPPSVRGGEELRLFGRNLDLEPVEVSFRAHRPGQPDQEVKTTPTSISTNMLVVTVPPEHPGGNAEITVTTRAGDPNGSRSVVCKGFFVELEQPQLAPAGSDMNPKTGPAGAPVTLSGQYLNLGDVVVKFGATKVDPTSKSAVGLTVPVPAGLTEAVFVTVQTSGGGPVQTAEKFTPSLPPTFDTQPFSPPSLPVGQVLTISGRHFSGFRSLAFRPQSGPDVPVPVPNPAANVTDNMIKATVPNGSAHPTPLGTYRAVVTTDAGMEVSTQTFIVEAP